ncbi:tRNA (adenosine(37)-N6)-threonylcarbamoyltransferase complex dimerization subunit type 1 TsaB [Arcanobacterium haemolyticum]|nr:tRNA (adenosine(37)-N6)-threonylcarbamoyltransferase complex dimerization subunit type 1 TsaB [Arcanobacterium haemolyticum]
MKILTIDTSTLSVVGIVDSDANRELAREVSPDSRHHAETLIPMVQRVCETAKVERPDLIVAGTGPAAFTGLRAGLMTARALGRGWSIPVIGVSSLEVVALAGARTGANEVLALIDARRKELFCLRARPMGPDDVEVLDGPSIIAPSALPGLTAAAPAVLVTPDPLLYPELIGATKAMCEPLVMADLALSHMARSEAGEDINLSTEPQYLRRPDIHGGIKQPQA